MVDVQKHCHGYQHPSLYGIEGSICLNRSQLDLGNGIEGFFLELYFLFERPESLERGPYIREERAGSGYLNSIINNDLSLYPIRSIMTR